MPQMVSHFNWSPRASREIFYSYMQLMVASEWSNMKGNHYIAACLGHIMHKCTLVILVM